MPYSKLYILTELSANDVKFISVDRQKLDLSKYIYFWYRKFYICRDTAGFYEHKKMTLVYKDANYELFNKKYLILIGHVFIKVLAMKQVYYLQIFFIEFA